MIASRIGLGVLPWHQSDECEKNRVRPRTRFEPTSRRLQAASRSRLEQGEIERWRGRVAWREFC
jgi:hypothetical protein